MYLLTDNNTEDLEMVTAHTIEYIAAVNTPAGWRPVDMKGTAARIPAKRVEVTEVTHIDGEPVSRYMSRTGAKRQQYDGSYFAEAEVGKIKNISTLRMIDGEGVK